MLKRFNPLFSPTESGIRLHQCQVGQTLRRKECQRHARSAQSIAKLNLKVLSDFCILNFGAGGSVSICNLSVLSSDSDVDDEGIWKLNLNGVVDVITLSVLVSFGFFSCFCFRKKMDFSLLFLALTLVLRVKFWSSLFILVL